MDEKSVTIITGSGKELGTGHLQRMLNLASFINRSGTFKAFLLHTEGSGGYPVCPDIISVSKIPEETSLIIRDMRDSQPTEIKILRKKAPVLVVDDAGEGRFHADYRVDLLPGLYEENDPREELFLYGYNFTDSVKSITDKYIEKSNDLLIYGKAFGNSSFADELTGYLPHSIKFKIADSGIKSSYAETLISSKIILTHFGIMLYEARLSRCGLVVINPSPYHAMLTDKVSDTFPVLDLGLTSTLDFKNAAESIVNIIDKHEGNRVDIRAIYKVITQNLSNFYDMIGDIIK